MVKIENSVDLAIVVPVMNEEDNVGILAQEIDMAMSNTEMTWECIWVDDMSTDSTRQKLKQLNSKKPQHKYIFHTENFGQSAALATGFRNSNSKYILTLDGDGQNDPASIPDLIQKIIATDADVVNGWRVKRNDSLIRKISSKIGNGFRNLLTKESVRDVGCALRIFKRECVKNIPVFKGMHRYLPTLIRMAGYNNIIEIPVKHRPRERGVTKYGISNRLWVGIADTIAVRWMLCRMVNPTNENE